MTVDAETLEQLTRAMCDEPASEAPLAVCADYFEQQGDARAGYLRDQLRLRERPEDPEILAALRKAYPVDALPWVGRLEQAGVLECNLTGLPSAWWGGDLPGRESRATYTRFEYAKLARLPVDELDGSLGWLRDNPLPRATVPAGGVDPDTWRRVLDALVERDIRVPAPLRILMEDPTLQGAIPTPTGNYFISAKPEDDEIDAAQLQAIDATGATFLPFYSDQQCCARWGVWLVPGEPYAPVLSANVSFGDNDDDPIVYLDFELAAPDVERYLYRMWIEGRIWYAGYDESARDLLSFEQRYLDSRPAES